MNIKYSKAFKKHFNKAPKHIQSAVKSRLVLFTQDPSLEVLNNHTLTGTFRGYRSINITGDWRAIYTVRQNALVHEYYFELLGTHSQLY